MRHKLRLFCIAAFLLLCVAVAAFLSAFTHAESGIQYTEWSAAATVSPDGSETAFPPLDVPPELTAGGYYRFSTTLPDREETQWLLFEVSGLELSVELSGEVVYRSAAQLPDGAGNQTQVQIPLAPGGGEVLVMAVRQVGNPGLFPPLLRLTADPTDAAGTVAYANYTALPAGAYALALLLVWGLFLLGLFFGKPDWSLLPLALAAAGLTVYRLSQAQGWYFLPQPLLALCAWSGLGPLTALALLVYLAMNRRRSFWRMFATVAALSAGALAAMFLISRARGGYLARYLYTAFIGLIRGGTYDGLLHWLTLWLVVVCAGLSTVALLRSLARAQSEMRATQVKYALTVENHREFLARNQQTAAMRHEWNNQLAALSLLQQAGDLDGLGHKLQELEGELARLATPTYTDQPAFDTILQNAAYRADRLGVTFQGQALVPGDLKLDEADLCALLLNMLDNALEAAARVPPPHPRTVTCKLKLVQGFLAVWCQNTYSGDLTLSDRGQILTSKADRDSHGFGLAQMRAVAAKYHSVLDIDYDGNTFTVQTALKLP